MDAISHAPLTGEQIVGRLTEGFGALLVHPILPFVHPLVAFLFLGYLAVLISGRLANRTWLHGLIWAWTLGTMATGLMVRGYCYRPSAFDLHRSMIIIPPLVFAMMDFWGGLIKPTLGQWRAPLQLACVALLAAAVCQCLAVRDPVFQTPPKPTAKDDFAQKTLDFARRLPGGEESRFAIVLPPGTPPFPGLRDFTWYFGPGGEIWREPLDAFLRANPEVPFIALVSSEGFVPEKADVETFATHSGEMLPPLRLVKSASTVAAPNNGR